MKKKSPLLLRTISFLSALIVFLAHPAVLVAVTAVGTFVLFQLENQWAPVPFALAITATIAGLLFFFLKRLIFSFYMAWLIVLFVSIISFVKYKAKGFSLHYYDLVFASTDTEVAQFLLMSYMHLIAPLAAIMITVTVAAIALFKLDHHRRPGTVVMIMTLLVPMVCLPLTFPSEAAQNRYFYYLQGRHTTAFFVSLLDLGHALSSDTLEKRLAKLPEQPPFDTAVSCPTNKPDVFVVLAESQTDPAIFPQLEKGVLLNSQMAEANGPLQPLTVETFGGGTWISNLSLMTGLSSAQFGWRSPYLTVELEGKVKSALPELFAKCGYRTVSLLPMNYSFVNEGPFLKSIGFESVIDMEQIEAPHYHMRDRFYYRAAEKIIAEHRKTDGRPLFFTMQTMFAHSPYEERLEPDVIAVGEPFHDDPKIAEYLRRVSIAGTDLKEFTQNRRSLRDERGMVLLTYGDHQGFATKPFVDELAGVNAMSTPGSLAYRTYFTMSHSGPKETREFKTNQPIDIALLGSKLLSFTDFPMNGMWSDLAKLDALCGGVLNTCSKQADVELHLRRRMDSGLLRIQPESM